MLIPFSMTRNPHGPMPWSLTGNGKTGADGDVVEHIFRRLDRDLAWWKIDDEKSWGWVVYNVRIGDIACAVLYKMFFCKWDIWRLLIGTMISIRVYIYIYLDVSIYFFYCVLLFGFAPGILRSCLWHDRTFSKVIYHQQSGHVTLQSSSGIFQHRNLGFFSGCWWGDHDGVVTAHELLTACSDTEVRTALQWTFPDAKLEDLKIFERSGPEWVTSVEGSFSWRSKEKKRPETWLCFRRIQLQGG